MKIEFRRSSIQIIPQTDQDEVYLEAVTGLKKEGEECIAKRVAPHGLSHAWAYLEVKQEK